MFESRPMGRSGIWLSAAGIRRDCSLWVNMGQSPHWAFARNFGQTYNNVSPSPVWSLNSRWVDRFGLALLLWRKRTMPDSWERGVRRARRLFHDLAIGGSALRMAWRRYLKNMSAILDPWQMFAIVLADIRESRKDSVPQAAAGSED
jgi:hypothetical protein